MAKSFWRFNFIGQHDDAELGRYVVQTLHLPVLVGRDEPAAALWLLRVAYLLMFLLASSSPPIVFVCLLLLFTLLVEHGARQFVAERVRQVGVLLRFHKARFLLMPRSFHSAPIRAR